VPATLLQLSEAQRTLQGQIADALGLLIGPRYRAAITGKQTDAASSAWAASVLPLVLQFRQRSAALSQEFYLRSRQLEAPGARIALPRVSPDPAIEEAVMTSLLVTGVIGVYEKIGKGKPLEVALAEAEEAAIGAASRHALEGGRSYTRNAVAIDELGVGYFRQTRDGCCSFCAVLASRGAVYKADSFKYSDLLFRNDPNFPTEDKVHDKCHCTLQPTFRTTSPIPDRNKEYEQLWKDATVGKSGKAALNAFRVAYEAKYLPATLAA